jgi:hypothetical protein
MDGGMGIANWAKPLFKFRSVSAQVLAQSRKLAPRDTYIAIWRDIANLKSNAPRTLRQDSAVLDMTRWPAAAVRLYVGDVKSDDVFNAANDAGPKDKQWQLCQARVFVGILNAQQRNAEDAKRHFQQVVNNCPKNEIDSVLTRRELKALSADPD